MKPDNMSKRPRMTTSESEHSLLPMKRVYNAWQQEFQREGESDTSQNTPGTSWTSTAPWTPFPGFASATDPFQARSNISIPNHWTDSSYSDRDGIRQLGDEFLAFGTQDLSLLSPAVIGHGHATSVPSLFASQPGNVSFISESGTPDATSNLVEVCFGQLCDVHIQIDPSLDIEHLDCEGFNFSELVTHSHTFLTLQLIFEVGHCSLQTKEGRHFGFLNQKLWRSLAALPCLKNLEYLVLVGCNDWRERIYKPERDSKLKCLSVDINISGPRCDLQTVAKGLSRAGLFLQPPHNGTTTLIYDNPQYLYLPGVFQLNELSHISTTQNPSDGPPGVLRALQDESLNDRSLDLEKVFDELPQHDYLQEAIVDSRVKTTLLSHQKEAIDFVVRRETWNSPSDRSLWERQDSNKGVRCYQHRITGAKSSTPADFLGGILADDMGLGKSLTMLCVIVGSLNRAAGFVQQGLITSRPPSGEALQLAKSTLIIVPSALLLDTWLGEVDKFDKQHTLQHRGIRLTFTDTYSENDVVLTTYGTVVADFTRSANVLERIKWYRVIVDEAHVIRNISTKQFRAINRIPAYIRWCLSGTPIQNTLADLGALVAFLGIPILKEPASFRKYIEGSSHSSRKLALNGFENLRLVLGAICLRRSKAILPLFNLVEEVRRIQFSTKEREEYRLLQHDGRIAIDLAVSGHNTKATHQSVIESLLRLRIFCNNGSTHGKETLFSSLGVEDILNLLQQSGESVCQYCSCDVASVSDVAFLTQCRRLACVECSTQFQQDLAKAQQNLNKYCPFCSDDHSQVNLCSRELGYPSDAHVATERQSSKLMALLEDIQKNPLNEKSIVFTFWKKTLDLVEATFKIGGIRYCRIDGSLPLRKRIVVLTEFQEDPNVGVLIMTLGTGAVGLNNLSIASRLYLLEPQWNPSVENQAIGRVFRLGQQRPVTVIRYIMDKTIEDNVKNKQIRKLRLAYGGFDAKSSSQRIEQLQKMKDLIF